MEKLYCFSLSHTTPEGFGTVPKLVSVDEPNKKYYQLEGQSQYLNFILSTFLKSTEKNTLFPSLFTSKSPSSSPSSSSSSSSSAAAAAASAPASSLTSSTLALIARVLCSLIRSHFSKLHSSSVCINSIYSMFLQGSAFLDAVDFELLKSTLDIFLDSFYADLQETENQGETNNGSQSCISFKNIQLTEFLSRTLFASMAHILSAPFLLFFSRNDTKALFAPPRTHYPLDLLQEKYIFFDIVIQGMGEVMSHLLSALGDVESNNGDLSSIRVDCNLDRFLAIVYSARCMNFHHFISIRFSSDDDFLLHFYFSDLLIIPSQCL